MSFSAIETLNAALAAFENASEVDQRAAANAASRFARRVLVKFLGTKQEQYEVLMRASFRRLPEDIQLLKDISEFSEYPSNRQAATEELDERTRIAGSGRRLMPSETAPM